MTRNTAGARIALSASLLVLVLGLVLAPGSLAGKGGGGKGSGATSGGGTLTLVLLDSTDGLPHWGQRVTYTVSTTATAYPYVSTVCHQGTTLVLSTSAGFFPSYPWPDARIVPLKTQLWTAGAADCTATLYSNDGGRQRTLATQPFHVSA